MDLEGYAWPGLTVTAVKLQMFGRKTRHVWHPSLLEHIFCLLFTLRCNHGYKPSTKRLPPTFLMYWHLPNQPTKTTSIACFLVCKFFIRGKKMQTQRLKRIAFIFFFQLTVKQSPQSHLTSCEIPRGDLEGYSVALEGKKFSKRRRHDVLVLIFWLGALEFKIVKFLFFYCLYIFLGNFPQFSLQKSLKILEK